MTHTAIALAIVCGTMFITIKAVDLLFAWLNIMPEKEGIQPSQPEQVTGRVLDSLQLHEYASPHYGSTANTEIEAEVVCSEAIDSLEALSEGLQAAAESAVEYTSAIIECLSNS